LFSIWGCIGIGLAVGSLTNVVHFCYCIFLPLVYIKAGFFIGIGFALLLCLAAMLVVSVYFAAFPGIVLILSIIMFCLFRRFFGLSASVMDISCKLICRFPSIILVVVGEAVIEVILSVIFALLINAIFEAGWSFAVFIWVCFSFMWTTTTVSYIAYITISGLAATWYFLNDTEYMPASPVWMSLKRAMTTSFGSAALGAFLLAVVHILQMLADMESGSGAAGVAVNLIRCCALCCLAIIECFVRLVTRYALIYCATFGLSFIEGCERWLELTTTRFIELLVGGLCITTAVSYNMLIFAIGSALLGFGFGALADPSENSKNIFGPYPIFSAIFAALFSYAIFSVLAEPVIVLSDTLLVCFVERPDRLQSSASELAENLTAWYTTELDQKVSAQNPQAGR
jgi:hypothetical protein